jgi:manganese transport system permease protein
VTVLDLLLDPLTYGFMARATATVVVAAAVCGLLSCWLVLVGWSLMGDAVSHSVLPGVVLAYAVGAPFAVGATVFGLLCVVLVGLVRDGGRGRVKEDAAIGVVFTTLFALGLVLVSVTPSQVDLGHIVFGNVLGTGTAELAQVVVIGALVALVLLVKRRDLTLYAFDPVHAHAIGLSPRLLGALLLGLLALTAVVALQAVGVVLVVAMLVIPGVTAALLTDRFAQRLVLAPSVAVACSLVGVYTSYYTDTSTAGAVVVAQGLVFGVVLVVTRLRLARQGGPGRTRRSDRAAAGDDVAAPAA